MSGPPSWAVLHLDDQMLVVDKPAAGMSSPVGVARSGACPRSSRNGTVASSWCTGSTEGRACPGLRPDGQAHRAINLAFDRGEPKKRYLALIAGVPEAERRIDVPIAPARRGRMRPARPGDPRGKASCTVIRFSSSKP